MRTLILFILVIFCTTSCLKKVDVGSFDTQQWENDPEGCLAIRPALIKDINENKKAFLGLYQKDVIRVFGLPEEQELYNRSQTYYIYYLDAAESCDEPIENPRKLYIRFTSLGIANELTIK